MEGNGIPGPVKKEMSHRDMALFLKEYKSLGIGGRNMVTQRTFGTLPSGEEVQIYHLENKSGAFAEVLQFGAILVSFACRTETADLQTLFWDMMICLDMRSMDAFSGQRSEEAETALHSPDLHLTVRK